MDHQQTQPSSNPNPELNDAPAGPPPPKENPSIQPDEPGVYVRTNDYQPHELDLLWSGSKHFSKEERSPYIYALTGLLIGGLVAGLVVYLFTRQPEIKTGENDLMAPIVQIPDPEPAAEKPEILLGEVAPPQPEASQPQQQPAQSVEQPKPTPKPKKQSTKPAEVRSYVVRNGDTLERIARRYYGSGAPQYIQKIQRANKMSSPHRLSIGQKLVIPPKDY